MPRYFFHRTDGFVDIDTDGTELEGLVAARVQAVIFAAETLRDRPDYLRDGKDFRVEVADHDGRLLLTIVTMAIDAIGVAGDLSPTND